MTIAKGTSTTSRIFSRDYYSDSSLSVKSGESYYFNVGPNNKWWDFVIRSSPCGFNNFLVKDSKKRLPGVKVFCLCGTFEKNENDHFKIGQGLESFEILKDGTIYFLANDHCEPFWYKNNFGSIQLDITRIS